MINQTCDEAAEFVSAIEQLWEWVGEQQNKVAWMPKGIPPKISKAYDNGRFNAYSNVRLYMRKFFAGLIDFDNEGESQNERLPEDV